MRRTVTHRIWPALLSAVLWSGAALAEDYEVEVIVFRHTAPQAAGTWASTDSLPDVGAARRLAEPAAAEPGAEPAPFTRLPSTALRLAGADKLLAGSAAYEIVAHEAWRQPGDAGVAVYVGDQRMESPADVAAPGAATATVLQPRAEGTLRLQVALPDMRVQSDFVVLAGETPVRVRATRNLKSGELHYLDHELLGILLQVTSLTPTPASTAEMAPVSPNADVPAEEFSD